MGVEGILYPQVGVGVGVERQTLRERWEWEWRGSSIHRQALGWVLRGRH